ncbi:MAG: enoyl-CoA hydratase-related protein [Pseudomonadota bacterium]
MSAISLSVDNDVACVMIDNPAKRNALAISDLGDLSSALTKAADLPIRALILTGAGDRVFSGGVDLSDVSGDGQWDNNPLTAIADQLEHFPRPTIARIAGKVRGGAVELALACDFRIGAEGIDLWVPASRIGIHYEAQGLQRAASRIGIQATRRIYMLAELFGAEALARMGYLDQLVPIDGIDSAVDEMVALVTAGAPLSVDGMKATLMEIGMGETPDAADRIAACWASDDLKEGLAALREKRGPVFKGR